MPSPLQTRILKALFVALRPLARALLRSGLGYREFAEVAKAAFVDEASTGFGLRGRPTNISRIAIMTGITRKEVRRIRGNSLVELSDYELGISPAALLLQHWHTDPEYLGSDGKPLGLQFSSAGPSFATLVKRCAGDIPPGAMRTELKRLGAIREVEGGALVAIKREFVPTELDDRFALGLDSIIYSAAETLAFNCDPENSDDLCFQQVWGVNRLDPAKFREVKVAARAKLTSVANEFDDYLSNLESKSPDKNESGREVGIGLYYYEIDSAKRS